MTKEKTIEEYVSGCVSTLEAALVELTNDTMSKVDVALENNIDKAPDNYRQMQALESSAFFRKQRSRIRSSFIKEIKQIFEDFTLGNLNTKVAETEFHNEVWSLVDDSILEENIVINKRSSELNAEYKEKLWQLEQRFAYISDKDTIDEGANPLSPVQFFASMRNTFKHIPLHVTAKVTIYHCLGKILKSQYGTIANKANAYFIHEGIMLDIDYESHCREKISSNSAQAKLDNNTDNNPDNVSDNNNESAPSSDEQSAGTNHQKSGTQQESNDQTTDENSSELPLVNKIRNLLKKARNIKQDDAVVPIPSPNNNNNNNSSSSSSASNTASSNNTSNSNPTVFDASMIIDAVDSVQGSAATAHFFSETSNDDEILTTPTNITANSAQVYQQLQQQSPDGNISAKNMYTIDMVGMLFEYILSDENLPDSVKTLLSHLHTPFLKLAFLDETFFENKEHKSRMLLDSLADAGSKWVNHDGTAQYDMYREIKKVVKQVVKKFKNDVNLFAELLIEFNLLKKRIEHMHELRERNSIAKKEGQERHEQAKTVAKQTIKSKIDGKRVPSAIIGLLSPWFTHLTLIYLKEGEDSEKWRMALAVIDNLLTYCSITNIKKNGANLEDGFTQIIQSVTQGLENINHSPSSTKKIISELIQLKDDILNKETIKTTTTVDKRENTSANERLINDTPSPEEERVMNYIKLIEPGTWIEYDKTSRHKVSGFNSEARKYVLVDQSSQDVMMLTRLQLARDILSEKATVLDGSAKSLFERALQRIRHNLDKQVEASNL